MLHDEIARGAMPAGDPLPTEQELCDQFGVSRITVRRALADLATQGYITRRQGVDPAFREHHPTARQANTRSYMDELRRIHFETGAAVLEFDLRAAPQTICDKVRFAGQVLHILRVRRERRTGEPLLVTEAWLPAELAEVITAEMLLDTPLYRLLADAGITLDRLQHEFTAEIAGPRTAQLLDIAIGAALMRVNRLAFIGDQPHHYLSMLLSPSRSRSCSTNPQTNSKPVPPWQSRTTCAATPSRAGQPAKLKMGQPFPTAPDRSGRCSARRGRRAAAPAAHVPDSSAGAPVRGRGPQRTPRDSGRLDPLADHLVAVDQPLNTLPGGGGRALSSTSSCTNGATASENTTVFGGARPDTRAARFAASP